MIFEGFFNNFCLGRLKEHYMVIRHKIFILLFFLSFVPTLYAQTKSLDPEDVEKAKQHLVNGALFEAKDQYSQAIIEYEEALKYTPDAPAIYFSIAKSYKNLEQTKKAILSAEKAASLDSTNKWILELLGQLYFDERDFENAALQFKKILENYPGNYNALYYLAASYASSNEPQRALPIYQELLNQYGFDFDVLSQKFLVHVQLHQYHSAISTLEDMIIMSPENIELYRTLGDMRIKVKDYKGAIRAYQDALAIDPDDIKSQLSIAEAYLKFEDIANFRQAISNMFDNKKLELDDKVGIAELYFRRIGSDSTMINPTLVILNELQKKYPKEWKIHLFTGIIHLGQDKHELAIGNFKKVTQFAPENDFGWENLGVAYLSVNKFDSASTALKDGLKHIKEPKFRFLLLLGISLNQNLNDSEAIFYLEKALEADSLNQQDASSKIQAYSTLAISYDRQKRYNESIQCYEKALKLDPENALILNNLAYSLSEQNMQLERCLDMSKMAVEQEPDNGAYLDTIGWIYYKLGKYEEARTWIQKALDIGRASPVVEEHLGDVYFKLGDMVKAKLHWTNALNQDQNNISLQEKMKTHFPQSK